MIQNGPKCYVLYCNTHTLACAGMFSIPEVSAPDSWSLSAAATQYRHTTSCNNVMLHTRVTSAQGWSVGGPRWSSVSWQSAVHQNLRAILYTSVSQPPGRGPVPGRMNEWAHWFVNKLLNLASLLTIRLNRLRWFGHVQRMEDNRLPKRILYMNLGTTRLRGRPRNRRQDEVREDGRLVGGKGWKERVYNREEWKKLQRTARNRAFYTCQWNGWTIFKSLYRGITECCDIQLIDLHVTTIVILILYKVRLHVSTILVVILRSLINFKT